MTDAEFDRLPLVAEGESKVVRAHATDTDLCWIRLKPTIYSFTANRAAVVPGSDKLRLDATRVFLRVLREAGVDHAYVEVGDELILSRLVRDPPPIEVVVKAFHSGTSKHRYYGMGTTHKVRKSHPFYAGKGFGPEDGYPGPLVRFDWRNPCWHPERVTETREVARLLRSRTSPWAKYRVPAAWDPEYRVPAGWGSEAWRVAAASADPWWDGPPSAWPDDARRAVMLADEVLGDAQADWFIDVAEARKTALKVYGVLQDFLGDRDVVLYDLCLFIAEDGKTVFGEVSQDCGRFRHFDLGSLDKDVWRAGGSSTDVLEKWAKLLEVIS